MPERADEDVGSPETPDSRLAEALQPAVTAALRRAIRQEPREWAEALFPALLPAVRLAVMSALRGMVQTLNDVLEQSLSLRSWRWRLEAWRTGRPFGEIALLRTLVYRVEQVLLVERRAGLLLASVSAGDVAARDEQSISAMLTALQDFVADSFQVEAAAGIREVQVGDFTLLVEVGPRAVLAAAVRGHSPAEVRETLRAALDLIHQEFAAELREFRGDAAPFERCKTILEGCLQAQYRKPEAGSYTRVWVAAAAIVAALGLWIGLRMAETRRWERAVGALRSAKGIAVTEWGRRGGRYFVEGVRDPLASRPEAVLESSGMDVREVAVRFEPYLSLDPELVLRRARAILEPPRTVSTFVAGEILRATGSAPHRWIVEARSASPKLAVLGIRVLDTDSVADEDMEALGREIESAQILFQVDSSRLTAGEAAAAQALAGALRQWVDDAMSAGRKPRVTVLGYADRSGTEEKNRVLSRQRAERVGALLTAADIPAAVLSIEGRGPSNENAADAALERRVVIRLGRSDGSGSAR